MRNFFLAATAAILMSGALTAGEKSLMHCFAYTAIEGASQADWDAFHKASDELPKKMSIVKRVWYGKLRGPLAIFQVDAAASKKLRAGEKNVEAKANFVSRQQGMCIEFAGEADVLKAYTAHPFHATWMAAYEKVRVAGTTTYDILGQ
jgi:hypothetical protein